MKGFFKMKGAIIFDLDGTLLNTLPTINYFLNIALSEYGVKTITMDMTRAFVGNGPKRLVERALGEKNTKELFDKVFLRYDTLYNASPSYLTTVYDGISELLLKLKEQGYILGIISNKQEKIVKQTVNAVFGDSIFDSVMGQIDGVAVKPHPDAMARIISSLSLKASEVVYVGDSEVDIESGRAASLYRTIGVSWGFRSRECLVSAGAELIADNAKELYELISK